MKKKKIIAFVCLGLGILCGIVGLYKYMEEKNAGKEYEDIKKEVVKEETPDTEENTEQQETEETQTEQPAVEIPIDFAALQQQNPDVYAWIFC